MKSPFIKVMVGLLLLNLAACASADRQEDESPDTVQNNPLNDNIKQMMDQRMKSIMGGMQPGGKKTNDKTGSQQPQPNLNDPKLKKQMQSNMDSMMQQNMKQFMQQNMQQQNAIGGGGGGPGSGQMGGGPPPGM
ncbi:MAG: hypothetical protein ACE5GM_01670 [bacterium]